MSTVRFEIAILNRMVNNDVHEYCKFESRRTRVHTICTCEWKSSRYL